MKFIIKTTLLGGFTGAVWFMVFAFVCFIFNVYALFPVAGPFYWILTLLINIFYLDYDTTPMIALFLPFFPGLIYGLIAGFLFSLFWNRVPEHKRKEYKFLSSLKYRTHSFLSYFLFLGEGSLCIVTLSLPLFILHLIIYLILTHIFHTELWMHLTIEISLIMLIMSALLTALTAPLVRKCEAYNRKLFPSEADEPLYPSILEEEQQIPLSVGVTMFLGGILGVIEAAALTLYMLVMMVFLLLFIFEILVFVVHTFGPTTSIG